MCTGNEDCLDTSLITIPVGPTGSNCTNRTNGTNETNGQDGNVGGISARWRVNATTSGAPAATFLKFDSTVLSGVTNITVNDLNADNTDHNNFLASFQNISDAVSQWGLIRIWKRFDSNTFWSGKVTGTADAGTSRAFTVEHIESNGTFAASDELILSFAANGASASLDKEMVHYVIPGVDNGTTVLASLGNYTVPANSLTTDGDTLEGSANLIKFGVLPSAVQASVNVAGGAMTSINWILGIGISGLKVEFKVTRLSATTAFLDYKSWYTNSLGTLVPSYGGFKTIVFDTTIPNVIDILGLSVDGLGNTIKLEGLVIKKFDM